MAIKIAINFITYMPRDLAIEILLDRRLETIEKAEKTRYLADLLVLR